MTMGLGKFSPSQGIFGSFSKYPKTLGVLGGSAAIAGTGAVSPWGTVNDSFGGAAMGGALGAAAGYGLNYAYGLGMAGKGGRLGTLAARAGNKGLAMLGRSWAKGGSFGRMTRSAYKGMVNSSWSRGRWAAIAGAAAGALLGAGLSSNAAVNPI